MRDYTKFFRQLCLAMGIVTAGPVACGAPEANTRVDVSVGAQDDVPSGAGDVTGEQDTAGGIDTGEPGDTGGGQDVVAAEDVPPLQDVPGPAEDVPAAVDVVPTADGIADINDDDTPPPPIDVGSEDAGPAPDVGTPGTCQNGQTAVHTCYTAEELKTLIDNPPFGGKPGGEPYDGPLPPEGCPEPELVLDGCCNPAEGPGTLDDETETCCYQHCPGACCGRPLVIGSEARVAGLIGGSPWATGAAEAPAGLTPAEARHLAAAWREDARDEHASVASFMRFGLELLHLGAPPELVAGAARAAQDEVRHAQLTCELATALDGLDHGPGPLPCHDVLPRTDWAAIAAACVHEGCVGETLAAAQLTRAAAAAGSAVAERVRGIAADEARHAELAWAFVAWSWRHGGPEVQRAVREAFAAASRRVVDGDPREHLLSQVSDAARRRAGRLGAAEAHAVNRETLRQVVLPCAEALFAEEPA